MKAAWRRGSRLSVWASDPETLYRLRGPEGCGWPPALPARLSPPLGRPTRTPLALHGAAPPAGRRAKGPPSLLRPPPGAGRGGAGGLRCVPVLPQRPVLAPPPPPPPPPCTCAGPPRRRWPLASAGLPRRRAASSTAVRLGGGGDRCGGRAT